ncbi:MAG: ATP-grasp domain-containing protein, partial [Chlorobi bacterium]|nr:ATP-grasp domain-containing protein [Chlorobiota bacterium]
ESMRMLGSKTESRTAMINAGVPVAPGMKGGSKNISEFISEAEKAGYPVLIKAAAGGGGKGMRIVRSADEMEESVHSAMRESLSAFGSDEVFMEKYIESPRHVEIQIAADKHGNAVALFERECSIQRRHQKIIEEAPSTALTPELRKTMCDAAIDVVKTANYDSVGTVEFLLDKHGKYYFLEVNTRIQVEHPVTEMTTGIDLVKLQINIAAGEKLPFVQEDLKQSGHAIECRVYAEDADNNFMPSSGKILYLREPKGMGVRYDSGIKQGSDVTVFYDPVLAKLIVHGANREEARQRMIMALKENVVLGVKTSIAYMAEILEHPDFISGNTQTDFIEKHMGERKAVPEEYTQAAMAAGALLGDKKKPQAVSPGNGHSGTQSPWQTVGKWEIASYKI